jgi:DNA repair protein RecO (recombination protein O)
LDAYEGLILKQIHFKESSKILHLYTENGHLSVLVHGAKKLSSPFLHLTENLNWIRFYATGKEMKTLSDGELIADFSVLKANLEKFTCAQHITEMLSFFYESQYDHKKMYEFVLKILRKIETETEYLPYVYMFELKYLFLLGVAPNFNTCAACGATETLRFSVQDGGFACPLHTTTTDVQAISTVDAMKVLFYHDLRNPLPLSLDEETVKKIRRFLDDYYLYHLNFKSKSRQILAGLLGY